MHGSGVTRQALQGSFERNESKESTSSTNTFLNETRRNCGVGEAIRQEIEFKYAKSIANKTYRFPRTPAASPPPLPLHSISPIHRPLHSPKQSLGGRSSVRSPVKLSQTPRVSTRLQPLKKRRSSRLGGKHVSPVPLLKLGTARARSKAGRGCRASLKAVTARSKGRGLLATQLKVL